MSKKQKIDYSKENLDEVASKILGEIKEDFETLKKEPWILGVDEAGRGPVLGPMVYAACYWPKKYHELIFKNCHFDDSKKLTEPQRDSLFILINKLKGKCLQYECTILSAELLSIKQQAFIPENLNAISHNTALNLIKNAIASGFNIKECCIDTVGPKITYKGYLDKELDSAANGITVIVEEKADSTYPTVSAASICAKVTRDGQIKDIQISFQEKLKKEIDLGCGYPGDVKTKNFLRDSIVPIFGYTNAIRFSWATTTTAMKEIGLEFEYFEEDNKKPNEDQIQLTFAAKKQKGIKYRQIYVQNISI